MFNECVQDLPIQHLLDVMHVEWNICDNKNDWNISLVKNTPSMLGRTWRMQGLCQICNGGNNLVGRHISNLMHCTFSHMMKKNHFLSFWPQPDMVILSKKTCEKWKTNWIKKPWHACDGPTNPLFLCEAFASSCPKACHPCPKGKEDFSKAL
jgi:hypothetical protein